MKITTLSFSESERELLKLDKSSFDSLIKQNRYSIDSSTKQVHKYSVNSAKNKTLIRKILVESLKRCYLNIQTLSNAKNIYKNKRNLNKIFCEETGGVLFKKNRFGDKYFFKRQDRIGNLNNKLISRGARYYLCCDPNIADKSALLRELDIEYNDILNCLNIYFSQKVDHRHEIAFADYLKTFLLSTYHALVFNERYGISSKNKQYCQWKIIIKDCVRTSVEYYYRTILGLDNDTTELKRNLKLFKSQWKKMKSWFETNKYIEKYMFKYPELDHPLLILKFAKTVMKEIGNVDYVVGIESGGTEISYLVRLLYELDGERVTSLSVPLSRYSATRLIKSNKRNQTKKGMTEIIQHNLNMVDLNQKRVLVVDDNSNTGESAQLVYDAIKKYQPEKVIVRVAEFDIHRSIFKYTSWENPPSYISHPQIFNSSVGIAPVTHGTDLYLPFKQKRKINRLLVLKNHYVNSLKRYSHPKIETLSTFNCHIKICTIHNIIDLVNSYNYGVNWVGIHCLYDLEQYKQKVNNRATLSVDYELKKEYVLEKNSGLPLTEIESINDMMNFIQDNNLNINVAFLIDGENPHTLNDIIKLLIPKKYNSRIYFQLQNFYNTSIVKNVQVFMNKHGFQSGIIQTFGVNEQKNTIEKLKSISSDVNVDYILFDRHQIGGQGQKLKAINVDKIIKMRSAIKKPFFIAGGINKSNLKNYYSKFDKYGMKFNVDVESSIEKNKKYGKTKLNIPLCIRKDKRRLKHFYKTIKKLGL